MIIAILGDLGDDHARHMRGWLQERGADVQMIDTRLFPTQLHIDYDPVSGEGALSWDGGRRLRFDEIHSVYWRNYHDVDPPELPDPEQSYVAYNDSRSLLESLLIRLPVRWVNGWDAFQLHQRKPAALQTVANLGVRVPATVFTNHAATVKAFAAAHSRCIFKPVQGGAHTQRLEPQHLDDDHLREHLALAPVAIQEEVGGTNIRVFVAGERVLACELKTDALDYRAATPDITPHDLSQDMQSLCRRIAAALHLVWTGMDFRLTPAGDYVFLEANPSPMFLGFEQATGLPLTEMLGDLLLA